MEFGNVSWQIITVYTKRKCFLENRNLHDFMGKNIANHKDLSGVIKWRRQILPRFDVVQPLKLPLLIHVDPFCDI